MDEQPSAQLCDETDGWPAGARGSFRTNVSLRNVTPEERARINNAIEACLCQLGYKPNWIPSL